MAGSPGLLGRPGEHLAAGMPMTDELMCGTVLATLPDDVHGHA